MSTKNKLLLRNKEYLMNEFITEGKSFSIIAKEHGISQSGVWHWTNKLGIKKGMASGYKYYLNEDKVNADSLEMWYIVGLAISDGHLHKDVKAFLITLKDRDILDTICNYLEYPVKQVKPKLLTQNNKIFTYYSLYIGNGKLHDFLNTYMAKGNKTYTVGLHAVLDRSLFLMMLRGLIDGDGSIEIKPSKITGRVRIGTASAKFVSDYILLFAHHYPDKHISISKRALKSGNPFWSLETIFKAKELIELYGNKPEFAIKRKRAIVQKLVDDIVRAHSMINYENWEIKSSQGNITESIEYHK